MAVPAAMGVACDSHGVTIGVCRCNDYKGVAMISSTDAGIVGKRLATAALIVSIGVAIAVVVFAVRH